MWGNYITECDSHGLREGNHYFTDQTKKYDYNKREAGDSTVYFVNASTNKALTVSSTASGTVLTVAEFNGSEQQEFTILKTDTYPTVYKIYSQYANMVLEVDDCLVNGSFLRTKALSNPNKKQEFIIRAVYPSSPIYIDTNIFLSIRGSGSYSSLTVNDSNQVIMTDCGNTSAYQWHIRPKLYDGGAIYFSNDAANVTYNLVNVTNSTVVTRSMIARAAEYWKKTPNSKINISGPSSSATGIFDIMLVDSSDVPNDYSNAYAYVESYNTSNILDEDGDGEGYTGYHTTTEHSQVINWYWEGTIIYIIKDNIEAGIQNGNLLASDIHKVIAHEFGHALKQPHTAVNNKITSIMNTGNFTYYPTFTSAAISETDDGISFAAYDSNRALDKNYSA